MANDTEKLSLIGRTALISPGRIWTIATSTFTHLLRMKALYFLLVIILIIAILGNFPIFSEEVEQILTIKKMSFGIMDWFSWIFAIVATSVLIPRDLEDRTLYTILSKPVMRIEYLLGKFVGVMLLIGLVLAILFPVLVLVLQSRTNAFIGSEAEILRARGVAPENIEEVLDSVRALGYRTELWVSVWAIFVKSMVVAAVTLCLSTFATSSLFTIIVSGILFMVGNAIKMVTTFWEQESSGSLGVSLISRVLRIFIPDYQIFSFGEGIVLGEQVVPTLVLQTTGLGFGYCIFYLLLSLLVFHDKEF